MPKRIKRVFTNHSEVIHRWANQTQSDARCKNVFFEGKSIYSYGYHYELGRLVEFRGQTVAIINDRGYSVTTSKHIHSAKYAVAHLLSVNTDGDFEPGCIERALTREQGIILDRLFNHFNRVAFRTWEKPWGVRDEYGDRGGYARTVEEFNRKARALGFERLVLDLNDSYIDLFNEKLRAGIEREKIRDAETEKKREAARLARLEQTKLDVNAWRAGAPLTSAMHEINPMILRLKDDVVETSRGASVTLTEARLLLRKVEARTVKKGDAVGDYTFERLEGKIMVIGCHRIAVSELKTVVGRSRLALVASK